MNHPTDGQPQGWQDLTGELDRWAAAGRTATFWWRDDDAGAVTPALERLLELTAAHGIVPMLAVVPDWAGPDLGALLAPGGRGPDMHSADAAIVAQHGVGHRDLSGGTGKKMELVDGHPGLEEALRQGRAALSALFGETALPVLVPPWNRIGDGLRARLSDLGYRGLSAYTPRKAALEDGLTVVNCHCDPVAWHEGRGFLGREAAIAQLTGHLRNRRLGRVDPAEPTGLMSHHAVHDPETWRFLETLAACIAVHPAGEWQHPRRLFAASPRGPRRL